MVADKKHRWTVRLRKDDKMKLERIQAMMMERTPGAVFPFTALMGRAIDELAKSIGAEEC